MSDALAHHFRMLGRRHGRSGHQILQLRNIAIIAIHRMAQNLDSRNKVDAKLLRAIHQLPAHLTVPQNDVETMTLRRSSQNKKGAPVGAYAEEKLASQ